MSDTADDVHRRIADKNIDKQNNDMIRSGISKSLRNLSIDCIERNAMDHYIISADAIRRLLLDIGTEVNKLTR